MSCNGVKGTITQTRAMGALTQIAVLGIICHTGYTNPLNPSYVYYDDGETWVRKGVRDGVFVLDMRITADPGWDGVEDTDWKNLKSLKLEGSVIDIYWSTRYPSDLLATSISDSQIDLSWTNNGNEDYDGVSIERSEDGSIYAEIDTCTAGDESYSDTTCEAETLYYYRIRYYKE